jgi:hypothetical protein
MRTNSLRLRLAATILLLPAVFAQKSFAWGHDGHSLINRLAVADLPPDVPAFLKTAATLDAVSFYAPEPDQWLRKSTEPTLYAADSPDHFLDMEWADLIVDAPASGSRTGFAGIYPRDRWDYIFNLTAALARHPEVKLDAVSVGLLPYAAVENFERLKSTFRHYRLLLANKQDTRPIEAEIVFEIGILGHFIGDGSQPLHTTIQYNGWTGPNPNGYTTEHKIHSAFEGDFVHNNLDKLAVAPLVPSKPTVIDDVFVDFIAYLRSSHTQVEKTYQLYKAGAFDGAGTQAGRDFTNQQLAAGTAKLRDVIYTAWVQSSVPLPPDRFN